VKKKALLKIAFISALLFSAIAGAQFVRKVEAWPPYEPNAESLITITVASPEYNKLYNTKTVKLNFNVALAETTDHSLISNICYEASWQKENVTLFSFDGYFLRELMSQLYSPRTFHSPINRLSKSLELTDIPEGNHSIKIYATIWHYSSIEKLESVFESYLQYHDLTMASRSVTVFFNVDTVPPKIVFSSPKNVTHNSSDVSLDFTVDELCSKCSYSLDGQNNVTIAGNMTLVGLPNGDHNVTIYVTDKAGNTGVSETIYFSVDVPEPFPTTLVVASIVTVSVAVIGLFVYFKKRKR
jgi:hypothetical protein